MNRYNKYSLLILLFTTLTVYSQSDTLDNGENRFLSLNHWLRSYPHHIMIGVENGFLKNQSSLKLIAGVSAVLISSNFDDDIVSNVKGKPFLAPTLSKQADNFGKSFGWGYFAGVGFITLESLVSKNNMDEYFSKIELVLESIAVTQIITQTLKTTVNRQRPNFSDNHSFPSGHTSSVFALAASMNGIYGWKVGVPAFICASIVGAQRISSSSHYLSDVLSGALIGLLVGNGFSEIHREGNSIQPIFRIDQKTSSVGAQLIIVF